MKWLWFIGLLVFVSPIKPLALKATSTINLINPDTVDWQAGQLVSTEPIAVKVDTTYTFTLPEQGGGTLSILQAGTTVFEEDIAGVDQCVEFKTPDNRLLLSCTFETVHHELTFALSGGAWDQWHAHNPDLDHLQLEIGETFTSYVPYQPVRLPVFQGSGTLTLSYREALSIDTIITTYISAYDEIDGEVGDNITVLSDAYTGHESTVGDYEVMLSVTDESDNEATFALTITVEDDEPPIIDGPSFIAVDVNDALTLTEIIEKHFDFYDEYDGEIEAYDIIVDHYRGFENALGTNTVLIGIKDRANNQTQHHFEIHVKDYEAPIITGPDAVTFTMSEGLDEARLLSKFSVHDNHTPQAALTLKVEANWQSLIETDHAGTVELSLSDASGNTTTHPVYITYLDDIAPVLDGPTVFELSYQDAFSLSDILATLIISDNVDDLTKADVALLDSTFEPGVIGAYQKTLQLIDNAGNVATHTITINVIDDVPPVFNFHPRIQVCASQKLSKSELFAFVNTLDDVQKFGPKSMQLIKNEYTDHHTQAGHYEMVIKLSDDTGATKTLSAWVDVNEQPSEANHLLRGFLILSALISVLMAGLLMKHRSVKKTL